MVAKMRPWPRSVTASAAAGCSHDDADLADLHPRHAACARLVSGGEHADLQLAAVRIGADHRTAMARSGRPFFNSGTSPKSTPRPFRPSRCSARCEPAASPCSTSRARNLSGARSADLPGQGASQIGTTLAIDGCTAAATLLAGDYFSVNEHELQDGRGRRHGFDGNGNMTPTFEPRCAALACRQRAAHPGAADGHLHAAVGRVEVEHAARTFRPSRSTPSIWCEYRTSHSCRR